MSEDISTKNRVYRTRILGEERRRFEMKGFVIKNDQAILTYIKVVIISVTYFIILGLSLGLSAVGLNGLGITL